MSDGAGLPTARRPMPGRGGVRADAPVGADSPAPAATVGAQRRNAAGEGSAAPQGSADLTERTDRADRALEAPSVGTGPSVAADPGARPRPRPSPSGSPLSGSPLSGSPPFAAARRDDAPSGNDVQVPDPEYAQRFGRRFRGLLADTLSSPDDAPSDELIGGSGTSHVDALWRRAFRFVLVVLIVAGAVVALRTFVVGSYYIPSASMEPTLHGCKGCNDDHILVDKLSYRAHPVRAGDIVVFDRPKGDTAPENVLIKRVIGLGGDTVSLRDGLVYVDGAALREPYVNAACGPHPTVPLQGQSSWKVPAGDVFVLGDNRCNSSDSRVFGPIATSTIVGRAFAIIWPLSRAGSL